MKHIESKIQQAIVRYLRLNNIFVFAVGNGGKRNKVEASIMNGEGVLAGVSDLIILLPKRAIFIEIKKEEIIYKQGKKTIKKTYQNKNQKIFESNVNKLGFEYYVWRSIDDAVEFVKCIK